MMAGLVLEARRRGWEPPPLAGRLLRRFLAGDVRSIRLEDWTTALVGDGPLAAPPLDAVTLELGYETPVPAEPRPGGLKCLIAVGDCDVAGCAQVGSFLTRRLGEHGIDTALAYSPLPPENGIEPPARLADQLRSEGWSVTKVVDERGALALLDAERVDVISAHGAPEWWIDAAADREIPLIETLHLPGGLVVDDWRAESSRSRRIARIVAVSELLAQDYLVHHPDIDPGKVTVIPNSIDERRLPHVDRRRAREWLGLTDEFLFVSLGRFTIQKNTFGLVSAFDRVAAAHPDAHLLIAGRLEDPGYGAQVIRFRDSLACGERVHLRDHCAWPSALLAAADGFVLASFFEGFPLSSIEALFAGLPVVLPDVGGAREQVDGGDAGYLVGNPLGDPLAVDWASIRRDAYRTQGNQDALVSAMGRMIADRELWAARREELRARAADRFHAHRALALHAELLQGMRTPARALTG